MMLLLTITIVSVVAHSLLAVVVIFSNPKSGAHRVFGLLALSIIGWVVTLFLYYYLSFQPAVLLVGRLNFFASGFIGYFFAVFVYFYARGGQRISRWIVYLVSAYTFVIAAMTLFTPLVDKNEIVQGAERIVEYGPLYSVWVGQLLLSFVLGVIYLVYRLTKSRGVQRSQLQFTLVGFSAFFVITTITNIIMPFFGNYSGQLISPLTPIIWLGLTTYSMVKHRLFDIRLAVMRSMAYSLAVLVLAVIYVGGIVAFTSYVTHSTPTTVDLVVSVSFALLAAISFPWLVNGFAQVTGKIFYRTYYHTPDLLSSLSKEMASTLDLDTLGRGVLGLIVGTLKASRAAIVTVASHKVLVLERGWAEKNLAMTELEIENISKTGSMMVFDELDEGDVKALMRSKGFSICLPLLTKTGTLGLLVLGEKSSGDVYFDQDVKTLDIVGPQLAVALQNAHSYRQIQEFSRTLEVKVEERTVELKEAQKRELELKDEFVFIATHDLRTPVTAIDGFLSLIKLSREKLSEDMKENLGAISDASTRLKQLVEDLLEVARSESGAMKLETRPVNVGEIVKRVIDEVKLKAREKMITIEVRGGKQTALADEAKLAEVLENLLSNAVKFNKRGGKVEVEYGKQESMVEISVKDTGFGIPKGEQKNVFAKLFKARTEDTKLVPGTGLGLFVVRMLVEKMGGKIAFSSKENVGTEFTFTLPIVKV